ATAILTNCTVADNSALSGGGILIFGDLLTTLNNTIAAYSSAGDIVGTGPGVSVAGSHNLIQDGGRGVALPPDTITGDPMLGPLADNGGPRPNPHPLPPPPPPHGGRRHP